MIITIDGPAGSGKSTVARKLAKKLGFLHINQGALFRAVGLEAVSKKLDLTNDDQISSLAQGMKFDFLPADSSGNGQLMVNGRVLSGELRTAEASLVASQVALLPNLRNVLLKAQREVTADHSAVVEGRDAGSVGFPEAELKLYLDAPLEVRAAQQFEDAKAAGKLGGLELDELTKQIAERDTRDSSRAVAPMLQAQDAVRIDTGGLDADGVVEKIFSLVENRRQSANS